MGSTDEDSEFETRSLDELEQQRMRLMEAIKDLPEESQVLSPISSPIADCQSPSPKRPRLGRAAGGRDSMLDESFSDVAALKGLIGERIGNACLDFSSKFDDEASCWRAEVTINNCICGSAAGKTREEAESESARIVLEQYSKEETNTSVETAAFVSDDDGAESESEMDSDLDVDELLEKPFGGPNCTGDGVRADPPAMNGRKKVPMFREKIVLKHRSTEYFEVLPDGWIEITHRSGLPVYLHKMTRVCCFSRPYFIGPGSVRNHEVPMASIPCLHQKWIRDKETERIENGKEEMRDENDPLKKLGAPPVQVQSAMDFKRRNLNPSQLHEYASKSFEFEKAKLWRFRTWSESRNHHKKKREKMETLHNLGRPSLPSNVKLITVPSMDAGSKPTQKQFFLNPQGKTSIAVLHEYVQKVLKGTVK